MKFLFGLFVLSVILPTVLLSQDSCILTGKVTDENKYPLPGANIILHPGQKGYVTDMDGNFEISGLTAGNYSIDISFLGYEEYHDSIDIRKTQNISVKLAPQPQTLEEVVVRDNYTENRKKEDPRSVEVVNDQYIKANLSGSLMKSLERLPGISSIEIGSGQSKPVIRGLGFNRVLVVENGIKHEGQQWGADHGLEIDQFAIDRIEVIKGPASLMYGSDAIGGIIDLKQVEVPSENTLGGTIDLTGKSINNLLGSSASIYARREKLYIITRATFTDYADYRVPTDSVDIYSYRAPLFKNRLRNTAGNEQDFHITLGTIGEHVSNKLFISNIRAKSGFFANAHGLEPRMVDAVLHDKSDRDTQFPFQEVNHFKVIAKNDWHINGQRIETEFGYQNNFRQEWSQYTPHGYMPPEFPDTLSFTGDLELQLRKDVYSCNLKGFFTVSDKISLTTGISSEYQHNRINGVGFVIPAFTQRVAGGFVYGKYLLTGKTTLHAGLRYDYGNIRTKEYYDWFKSPITNNDGDTVGYDYLQRAFYLNRNFNSVCWSVGVNYNRTNFSLKANLGKSFRMPIAKELAANGVNYHHFSYEIGNQHLSAEIAYQADVGLEWKSRQLALGMSPFFSYSPNYIYLNPSYKYDYLYGAGNQVYYYTQAKVARFGGEVHMHYELSKQFMAGFIGEYIYSEQLSGEKKGFTLPFSPPANMLFNLKFSPKKWHEVFNEPFISLDYKVVAAQNRIVPPEIKTSGYQMITISSGTKINWSKQEFSINLRVQNLLNQKYFNHTSYYRIINVPEAGRNFIINISIPFNETFK